MNEKPLRIQQLQQSEQPGGYWLISLTLAQSVPEQTLSHRYRFGSEQTDLPWTLSLFSYEGNRLQLLTDQPLPDGIAAQPEKTLLTPENPKEFQKALEKAARPEPLLLLGSDLGIAPLLFLARQRQSVDASTLALLHASEHFPFAIKPARFMLPGLPPEAIGACSLLEDWHVANRLASDTELPGCYHGNLTDFLQAWQDFETATDAIRHKVTSSGQVIGFFPSGSDTSIRQDTTNPLTSLLPDSSLLFEV